MKTFKGFTPQQQHTLLGKLGYEGPLNSKEMEKFLAASPQAAAKMGDWANQAKKRVEGIQTKGFNEGGLSADQAAQNLNDAQAALAQAQTDAAADPSDANTQALADAETAIAAAQSAQQTVGVPSASEATQTAVQTPTDLVTPANVDKLVEQDNQIIDSNVGQQGEVDVVNPSTVGDIQQAQTSDKTDTATVDPALVTDEVKEVTDSMSAATAEPSDKATVRGQLEDLMADFEQGTPPWASGAMREAMSVMQRRGMGASSMAGAAVVQAAMESAIGIASQDASIQAQFELENLNNEQQTMIFKSQQTIAGMFSDQAAENAAAQFNAASQNQTDQFFAELETTVSRFNAEQVNSIRQFNAGEENTAKQFNAQLKSIRDQFNAQNDLVIAQANAKWRQDIATTNSRAQNDANMESARQANSLTQRGLDQIWQRERDLMNFAFASSESELDRDLQILLADKNIAQSNAQLDAQRSNSNRAALGYLAGKVFGGLF